MVVFTATGLLLFYFAMIPLHFALIVRINGHTDFGAGLSAFEGRYALRSARMRACGEKKHWPWKAVGMDLEKAGIIPAVFHTAVHLLRHARVERLCLEGRISLPDAAGTALLCGGAHVLLGMLAPFAAQNALRVRLQPDFTAAGSDVLFSGMVSIRTGHIILAALIGAWNYMIRRISHGKASD